MNLLDYHRLRRQETETWNLPKIEEAIIQHDPAFPQRVSELLPCVEDRFSDDLRNIIRGPLDGKLAYLSRLFLQCLSEQRVYIRSRLTDQSGLGARARAGDRLESFGLRAATIGLREGSLEIVKAGLAAFAVAVPIFESRLCRLLW